MRVCFFFGHAFVGRDPPRAGARVYGQTALPSIFCALAPRVLLRRPTEQPFGKSLAIRVGTESPIKSRMVIGLHLRRRSPLLEASTAQGDIKKIMSIDSFTDPQTDVASGVTRGRHVRSRCRCSMCPAIHINSRSWLRSSSTPEPSDPPLRVVKKVRCQFGRSRRATRYAGRPPKKQRGGLACLPTPPRVLCKKLSVYVRKYILGCL